MTTRLKTGLFCSGFVVSGATASVESVLRTLTTSIPRNFGAVIVCDLMVCLLPIVEL